MSDKKPISVEITAENINRILYYLGSRPFTEVVELINIIQESKPLFENPVPFLPVNDDLERRIDAKR